MSERLFQYYDGLVWIGPFSLEEVSAKVQEGVITPETWITYASEPRLKAGDFPGLIEPDPETGSFKTVNMIQDWLHNQYPLSDESYNKVPKDSTNDYVGFYDFPERLSAIFLLWLLLNGLILIVGGVASFAFPPLFLGMIPAIVQFVLTVCLYNVIIAASKGYVRLMQSFQHHLRNQTELLVKMKNQTPKAD